MRRSSVRPAVRLVLALAALPLALPALSAPPRKARPAGDGDVHLPVTTFKLKNGLTVLVHEDHTVPIVAVNLWYHVGSKDEKPGKSGFAHLFEHLMFQGSAHVDDDEHLRLVSEAGGSANATTNQDRTNFFQSVPRNYLARVLFLEADRMGWFVEGITQQKLDTQRDVVLNERRQRYENQPYGMSRFAVHEALYPEGHPYRRLTIGSPEDLAAASVDDVKDFFRLWYTPDNATLAIAGDVKPAEARRLVEKYFAAIPAGEVPARHATAEPVALASGRRDRLEDRVSLSQLTLSWPSPSLFAPGDAELDLLATVLGGKSGRLYKRLVYDRKAAQSVGVVQASARLGSKLQIIATAKPGRSAAELEKLIDEEIAELLGPRPITEAEVARAKNRWEAGFVYTLESIETRADLMNAYFDHLGEVDGVDRDRRRYVDATAATVQAAAAAILATPRHALVVDPRAAPAAPRTQNEASRTQPEAPRTQSEAPRPPASPAPKGAR